MNSGTTRTTSTIEMWTNISGTIAEVVDMGMMYNEDDVVNYEECYEKCFGRKVSCNHVPVYRYSRVYEYRILMLIQSPIKTKRVRGIHRLLYNNT